jgi:sRNA-binding regulator protein Hfq
MEDQNPYLQELSSDLTQLWLTQNRAQLAAEVDQLSQANMLQLGMANRIAAAKKLLSVYLINGDLLLGKVSRVGLDAVLIKTSITNLLIPLISIAYIAGLPKAGNPKLVRNSIVVPTLFSVMNRRVVIDFRSGDRVLGELIHIWEDCIDIAAAGQVLTIGFSQLFKVEIGN